MTQDELLQKLVSLVGDDLIDNEKGSKTAQLERKMTAARDEYKKDFATTLKENEERFKQILKIQKINHNLVAEGFSKQEDSQRSVITKLDKLVSHTFPSKFARD